MSGHNAVVAPQGVLETITWEEFQHAIAPMWGVEDPTSIPIVNNPYRCINLPVEEWPRRMLVFPLRYVEDDVVKGYTCVYNVSRAVVRIRGIYILPEFRGAGAGMRMTKAAISLFPTGFHRLIGFFKEATAQTFIDHCSFKPFPNTDWLWSEYQGVRIVPMYWDRWPKMTSSAFNDMFVDDELGRFGLGGSNNLNRTWGPEEWLEWVRPHAFAYQDANLNVDF